MVSLAQGAAGRYALGWLMVATLILPFPLLAQEDSPAAGSGTSRRQVGAGGISDTAAARNIALVAVDKSLDTYHWAGIAALAQELGPVSFRLNEQFLSTLIRTDRNLITDNQSLELRLRYRLAENLRAATRVSSFLLSDNKGIGISSASSHGWYAGLSYQPLPGVSVEPMVGIKLDNQLDQHDRGPAYLLEFSSEPLGYAGYTTRFGGSLEYDRISPRVTETHNASISLEKLFFRDTRNELGISFYRNRRDFYLTADPGIQQVYGVLYNIETRSDNTLLVRDTLAYNMGDRMLLTFQGNLLTRSIDRLRRYQPADLKGSTPNTTIGELRIEGGAEATYQVSDRLKADFSILYTERDEKHQVESPAAAGAPGFDEASSLEERKNNHSRRTLLASRATLGASSSDTITLSGLGSILRYDTPSAENDDDRDELYYIFNITTSHRITRSLRLGVRADMSLTHVVYLMSSRSADNTWNRILSLGPSCEYKPWDWLLTWNSFEVLANYTVYDFEYPGSLTRSFVFRQFAFVDSTECSLTSRLALEWFSYLRLYERGELEWEAFAEHPVNSFEEKTYQGNIRYSFSDHLLFSVGIRYFSQLRFGYAGGERFSESFLRSIGPAVRIQLVLEQRTEFVLRGWYERQTLSGQPDRGFTTMLMALNFRI